MKNNSSFSLKTAITEKRIAAKMATGKFVDSGLKYDAAQAIADSSNPALRMTAHVDSNKLSWSR
jgi:hypothetical protein